MHHPIPAGAREDITAALTHWHTVTPQAQATPEALADYLCGVLADCGWRITPTAQDTSHQDTAA
ncbi:hypothetical protein [Streptomyces xiamenensis]|uniref:hypothetical protein n=1 Tax=Streptomyces xiamenensis TaxID=408015 RepID=UPI0037CE0A30